MTISDHYKCAFFLEKKYPGFQVSKTTEEVSPEIEEFFLWKQSPHTSMVVKFNHKTMTVLEVLGRLEEVA